MVSKYILTSYYEFHFFKQSFTEAFLCIFPNPSYDIQCVAVWHFCNSQSDQHWKWILTAMNSFISYFGLLVYLSFWWWVEKSFMVGDEAPCLIPQAQVCLAETAVNTPTAMTMWPWAERDWTHSEIMLQAL